MAAGPFKRGIRRGDWRVLSFEFPVLLISIRYLGPGGQSGEIAVRFILTNYPIEAPIADAWDPVAGALLPVQDRPAWNNQVREAFKTWNPRPGVWKAMYRAWERDCGAHNNWIQTYPNLVWNSTREITFALRDLSDVLNSSVARNATRAAAAAYL